MSFQNTELKFRRGSAYLGRDLYLQSLHFAFQSAAFYLVTAKQKKHSNFANNLAFV